jgi:hypothetical protein
MGDNKEQSSGKPNKFDTQNQHSEERKTGESPRQGEPAQEPKKEEAVETPKTVEPTK